MKPMRTAFSVHAKKKKYKKIRQSKHLTKTKEFLINTIVIPAYSYVITRNQTLWVWVYNSRHGGWKL